ncbi:MAG: DUF6326 family protein [Pseudomonadota bacterium]
MRNVDPHTLLPTLWLFVLLNIIFRDLHQFVMPGFLETIMTGRFQGMEITPELMLLGGVVVSVPISMIPLSVLLARRYLRPVTAVAAILTTVTMIPPLPMDLDDGYHLVLQLGAMAGIGVTLWTWPSEPAETGRHLRP